jgi:hypothetical protein
MKTIITPLLAMLAAGCMTTAGDDHGQGGPPNSDNTALALDFGGVRLVTLASGSTRPVAFGATAAEANAAVALTQGTPGREQQASDCSAVENGRLVQTSWAENGLDIVVNPQDGRFVGWNVSRPGLAFMNGVGVGSTRADLERAFTVTMVTDSSLDHEFWIGDADDDNGVGGLFDGAGPDARVTVMWSGLVCQHR